jgi:hypothetical protein
MGSSSFLAFGRDELRAHVVLDNRMFLITGCRNGRSTATSPVCRISGSEPAQGD